MKNTTERAAGGTAALVALAAVGLALPTTASASTSSTSSVDVRVGLTAVKPAGATYRALRRAKVRVSPLGNATQVRSELRVPITGGKAARRSELRHATTDGLVLRRGSRTVRVTGLRARLTGKGSRVTGRIDGRRAQTLFTVPSTRLRIDSTLASARTAPRNWRLTTAAARTLGRELGVKRLRAGVFARVTSQATLAVPGTANQAPAPGGAAAPGAPVPVPTPPPSAVACGVLPGDDATQSRVLDWGLRQSFRAYVGSEGSTVPSNGAAVSTTGTFLFGVSAVTGHDASGALSAAFRGAVYFEKWGTGEAAALRLWLCNPRIEAPAGAAVGALHVDMLSKDLNTGRIVEYANVRLADIDLTSGTRQLTGGAVRWSGVQTKLTAAGAQAFAGFYEPGAALDPLNLTVAVP